MAFFKAMSFFAAIIALVIAGYRMMHAMGHEEQLKSARNGIINVVIALVLMKVIDFIYLLAMDTTFFDQARTLIIKVSRILGYAVGIGIL
ncbi:MAG: hypothetical protein H6766_03995 [Candidatus Peribacteria bacterium]|nr:MAG: hypothetical protein H6766_03995 [Candidatus Peribacteria bacterium]